MKNLTTTHITVKQTMLGDLLNSTGMPEMQRYNNIKISLLNNAIVFPVSQQFELTHFSSQLLNYITADLKTTTTIETVGTDLFMMPFSPIGLGLMKQAVVYMLIDSHLYINIIPLKEVENANYTQGTISGLITNSKADKIYEYIESYVLSFYAADSKLGIQPYGRYYFTTSLGLPTILASHLEEGERILAKLDIHKIEKSKSNAQTSSHDEAFYLCTTQGAYLMVLDDNLQEKYIETLSENTMEVTTKIGRDLVTCGSSQWLCNRDNNKLFLEVSRFNNIAPEEKLSAYSQLHFNNADSIDDKYHSAELLAQYATIYNTPFSKFAAAFIKYCAEIQPSNTEKTETSTQEAAKELMQCAQSLLSETELETKLQTFLDQYKFTSQEIMALTFMICRLKYRIEDTKTFDGLLSEIKERYYKTDSDNTNRGFLCLQFAKKLNILGSSELAAKYAEDSLALFDNNPAATLAPGSGMMPDSPYTGNALIYDALQEMHKASTSEKSKFKYLHEIAKQKPLIKSNLDNLLAASKDEMLNYRINAALAIFDSEKMDNNNIVADSGIDGKFSKMSSSAYMPEYTGWLKPYSGFESWVKKTQPDKTFSSTKAHGILVDTNNYHLLYTICEQLARYFDIEGVDIYVFNNRNQGITSNDDGESKYIFVDSELLDINNPNYMNGNELTFALAREYAAIKLGIARLTCHPQWRNFSTLGVTSVDAIQSFAANADFIDDVRSSYNRILRFGNLLSSPGYFNFDIEDPDSVSEMLASTVEIVDYNGKEKLDDIEEREYFALSQLTTLILDRIAIMLSGNLQSSIKSIIHNDSQQRSADGLPEWDTVSNYLNATSADGKQINFDMALRLNHLLSFYISDNYKKY